MRYIQLGEFDANRLAYEVHEVLDACDYASEQETMKTADLPESKAAYRWFNPDAPAEGGGPGTTAGAGRRDWGSDGP